MDGRSVVAGVRADADTMLALLVALPHEAFARPTPCAAWDVAHLVAHLYRDFERIPEALGEVTDDRPDTDHVSYWRYDRAENQAGTQARADAILARFGTVEALVQALVEIVDQALRLAATEAEGAGRLPRAVRLPWGWVIGFDELVATRWVELIVHALDLTTALGVPDCVSDAGLAFVADTLDGLGGPEVRLSAALPWTAATYIRAATGRAPLSADGRAGLARLDPELVARFPLLA
jgi:uncharacterized protein (TIGR03083 family)